MVKKGVKGSWPIDFNNLGKIRESPIRKMNAWKVILYLVSNAYNYLLRWKLMPLWSWGKKRPDSGLLALVRFWYEVEITEQKLVMVLSYLLGEDIL